MLSMSSAKLRFFLLVALTAGLLGLSAWAVWTERLTEDSLRGVVEAGGVWSPAVFVVLASVLPMAWVPRMMISIVAGALFGFVAGSALALVGGVGGGVTTYYLGRTLGHDYVMKKIGPKGKAIAEFLARRGFPAIALGRISPVTNCTSISLGSGLVGLPLRVYVPATAAGMAPSAMLYAGFGSSVLTEDAAWVTAFTGAAALLLTVATGVWLWRMWKKDQAEHAASAGNDLPEGAREVL